MDNFILINDVLDLSDTVTNATDSEPAPILVRRSDIKTVCIDRSDRRIIYFFRYNEPCLAEKHDTYLEALDRMVEVNRILNKEEGNNETV